MPQDQALSLFLRDRQILLSTLRINDSPTSPFHIFFYYEVLFCLFLTLPTFQSSLWFLFAVNYFSSIFYSAISSFFPYFPLYFHMQCFCLLFTLYLVHLYLAIQSFSLNCLLFALFDYKFIRSDLTTEIKLLSVSLVLQDEGLILQFLFPHFNDL